MYPIIPQIKLMKVKMLWISLMILVELPLIIIQLQNKSLLLSKIHLDLLEEHCNPTQYCSQILQLMFLVANNTNSLLLKLNNNSLLLRLNNNSRSKPSQKNLSLYLILEAFSTLINHHHMVIKLFSNNSNSNC